MVHVHLCTFLFALCVCSELSEHKLKEIYGPAAHTAIHQPLLLASLPTMTFAARSMYQHILRTTTIMAAALMAPVLVAPCAAAEVPYNGTAALALSVGTRLAAMATALEDVQWSDTNAVYTIDASPYPSLRSLGQTHIAPPVAPSRERQIFAAFWGSQTYADDFVTAAITANTTFWGVDLGLHVDGNKTREEVRQSNVICAGLAMDVD